MRQHRDREHWFTLFGLQIALMIGSLLFCSLAALGRTPEDAWAILRWPLGVGGGLLTLNAIGYLADIADDCWRDATAMSKARKSV